MPSTHQKIDILMKTQARKWINSIDRPHYSTTLGFFFTGFFILLWSSSLTAHLGYELDKLQGSVFFIAIGFFMTFAIILINKALAWIGLTRSIRSALLLSSLLGPYIFLTTFQAWDFPLVSHLAGFIASIIAFTLSYLLDKHLGR